MRNNYCTNLQSMTVYIEKKNLKYEQSLKYVESDLKYLQLSLYKTEIKRFWGFFLATDKAHAPAISKKKNCKFIPPRPGSNICQQWRD